MKIIIAGSRTIQDITILEDFMMELVLPITEIISGCAHGVDRMGEIWAEDIGYPVVRFHASWYLHGKAAGPMRNKKMADYADCAVIIWDGKSKGTDNMIKEMKLRKKPVYIRIMDNGIVKETICPKE